MREWSLRGFAAAVIGLTASQVVLAADLARRAPPPPPAYVAPALLPYLWTGCYLGGNIGGAWANIDVTEVTTGGSMSASNGGFAGGGQIGCDYQAGAWVLGFRDMLDGTSLSKSAALATTPFTGTVDSRTHWFDTLTARGGYLVTPNVLVYAQGGAAWTNTDMTFFDGAGTQVGEFSNNRTGWTAGGGVEWMFAPHWSVFAEYNFMGFGTRSAALTSCAGSCILSTKASIQDALLGLNYKF